MKSIVLSISATQILFGCAGVQIGPEQRPAQIVSTYNSIYGPNGAPNLLPDWQSPHSGVDFGGNFGDPVIAPADGLVVVKVGNNPQTCGNGLAIWHHHFHRFTTYCHLQDVLVQPGQEVKRGDHIGSLGDSGVAGNCRPQCPIVHMELSTVSWGHPKATPGETFDALQFSIGCFVQGKTYPTDRLVLTYPVRCKD